MCGSVKVEFLNCLLLIFINCHTQNVHAMNFMIFARENLDFKLRFRDKKCIYTFDLVIAVTGSK